MPYNATGFKYDNNWMQIVLKELENTDVDFRRLDWQRSSQWIQLARLNPAQMLNYVFYANPSHFGAVNDAFFASGHRNTALRQWSGSGNDHISDRFTARPGARHETGTPAPRVRRVMSLNESHIYRVTFVSRTRNS